MDASLPTPEDGVFEHAPGASYLHLWREVILTYRQFKRRVAADTPFTGAQFEVLRQLAVSDGRSTASHLARELAGDPAEITRLVAQLTGSGLVERERDTSDGWRRPVVLTDEGRRRMADLHALLHERESALTEGIDPESIAVAMRVLQGMRAAADSLPHRRSWHRHIQEVSMEITAERHWSQRRFVALAAALSGLALPLTGLADHLAGEAGDPASWSIVHTSLGIVFVVCATWHCVLNRRALLKYVRGAFASRVLVGREALVAAALVGGVLTLTVLHAVVGP